MLGPNAVLAGAAFIGGGVVFGLIIGRWWALLIPPLVAWILFENTHKPGNDLAAMPLLLAVPVTVGVMIGVVLRKLAEMRDDSAAPF